MKHHFISALILSTILQINNIAAQNSYTLEQLCDSAISHNAQMSSARYNVEAARQQRKEAFTKYFPSVSAVGVWFNANKAMAETQINASDYIPQELGATLQHSFPPEALAALGNPITIAMMKDGVIGAVTAVQPIFTGGQIYNGNRLTRVGEDVSQLQLKLSENEIIKTTSEYFWQTVSLQEKLKTVNAVDSLLQVIYDDVETAVQAGVAVRNDLLQVQLRLNDIELQRVKINNGISLMKLILQQYCALSDTIFTLQYTTDQIAQGKSSTDPNQAVESTAEYQLLQKGVEAAELQKKMAVGKNLPSVAVGAGYTYHNLLDNDHSFGMLFATVNVPISDWWGGSHAAKRADIEREKAQDQLTSNAEMLKIRIHKARYGVSESQQQLAIAQKSIDQASENLRLINDRYAAGTAKMSDLLEAQLLYQQSYDAFTDAFSHLKLSETELKIAEGE